MLNIDSRTLPDVASSKVLGTEAGELEWVGMEEIRIPVQIQDSEGGTSRTEASFNAFVNLVQPEARGIHMSRLYSSLQSHLSHQSLDFASLSEVADAFLQSHRGLSNLAKIEAYFSAFVLRKALKSDLHAWRTYPVKLTCVKSENSAKNYFQIETEVLYSSTCPASAALSRKMIQENFIHKISQDFSEEQDPAEILKKAIEYIGSGEGLAATPHAQRSLAKIQARVGVEFSFFKFIDLVEGALQTPVQTIVKREDEQEFARLNANNLMFCEDAARRIQNSLDKDPGILDFAGRVSHQESLHSHNAVAAFRKAHDEKK